MWNEMSPADLRERLAAQDPPVVLDVREPEEIQVARFAGALEIPMHEVPARVEELDPDADLVVLCHHGMRSSQVAGFLVERGFSRISNLTGGIDAWSLTVDPAVPRY